LCIYVVLSDRPTHFYRTLLSDRYNTNRLHCIFIMLQIFHTSPFEYNREVEEAFLHAPVVTVAEAIGSPRRRRISVFGVITEVIHFI